MALARLRACHAALSKAKTPRIVLLRGSWGFQRKDPTPLDTQRIGGWGLKTRLVEGPKSIELEPLGMAIWCFHARSATATQGPEPAPPELLLEQRFNV